MNHFSAFQASRLSDVQTSIKEKTEFDFYKIPRLAGLFLLLLIFLNASARAQIASQAAAPQLSAEMRAAAIKSIKENFQNLYVFPKLRPVIIERLNLAQQSGRYDVTDVH
ncbi:MAG TPA: hypothetical protein VF692_07160, partial [Pyrinomonadaceae bacterium]